MAAFLVLVLLMVGAVGCGEVPRELMAEGEVIRIRSMVYLTGEEGAGMVREVVAGVRAEWESTWNRVALLGRKAEVEEAIGLLEKIDKEVERDEVTFLYSLKHAKAEEAAAVVSEFFAAFGR